MVKRTKYNNLIARFIFQDVGKRYNKAKPFNLLK